MTNANGQSQYARIQMLSLALSEVLANVSSLTDNCLQLHAYLFQPKAFESGVGRLFEGFYVKAIAGFQRAYPPGH